MSFFLRSLFVKNNPTFVILSTLDVSLVTKISQELISVFLLPFNFRIACFLCDFVMPVDDACFSSHRIIRGRRPVERLESLGG